MARPNLNAFGMGLVAEHGRFVLVATRVLVVLLEPCENY